MKTGVRLNAWLLAGAMMVIANMPLSAYAQGLTISPGSVTIGDDGDGVTIDERGVTIGKQDKAAKTRHAQASGQNFTAADFNGQDMRQMNLVGATFHASDLNGANFANMDLRKAQFVGSDLTGANFSGANLSDATFTGTDLNDANFSNACLLRATFTGVDASGANVSGAYLVGASIVGIDASGVNLHEAVRSGPKRCPGVKSGQTKQQKRPQVIAAKAIQTALMDSDGAIDLTVNFATDSDVIRGEARAQIVEIAKALMSEDLAKADILIEGHTDSVGAGDYNLDLSYRRAISVMKELTGKFDVDGARLSVAGRGEKEPVSDNDSEQGRALNRRVVLKRK